MKKPGLKGYVYDFSVDYDAIAVSDRHSEVFNEKEQNSIKMFRFVKRIFVSTIMFSGCNLSSVNPLECVSMNNQEYKVRPEIVNVNSNKPVFYPFIKAVAVATISMIPMQNCLFLMLLKTKLSKSSI